MSRAFPSDPASVRWLTERGVWRRELSYAENMRRCEEYRARMGRMGADPGKSWARDLVARYRAGEAVPMYSVRLAMSALGMADEPLLAKPAKEVPRPDSKDRAAGDVEVEF